MTMSHHGNMHLQNERHDADEPVEERAPLLNRPAGLDRSTDNYKTLNPQQHVEAIDNVSEHESGKSAESPLTSTIIRSVFPVLLMGMSSVARNY